MHRRAFTLLLLSILVPVVGLTGCVISSQEGDRHHVNSPHPEEIAFHFDTGFNNVIVFARSAALLLIPLWALMGRSHGGTRTIMVVLSVVAVAYSAWLFATGWAMVNDYRIEVQKDALVVEIPSKSPDRIGWTEIEGIDGEGQALDVTFEDGKGQALQYATYWEDVTITLKSGRRVHIDLRPLSVEQRGTLWRAVARKAELQVETWVEKASR